jgi:hypothetical protein
MEIAAMRSDIRNAYKKNPVVLGIFPVAAYNGGPRNVAKLYRVLSGEMSSSTSSAAAGGAHGFHSEMPLGLEGDGDSARPVSIPRYNNENRWYIEKYQSIVSLFEDAPLAPTSARDTH